MSPPGSSSSSTPLADQENCVSPLCSTDYVNAKLYRDGCQNLSTKAEVKEWCDTLLMRQCINQTSATKQDGLCSFNDFSVCNRICLVPVNWLKAHEQCSYDRYVEVFLGIVEAMGYQWPIIVDYRTGVILDGHHRFQVALALHLERIPAILVNYLSDDTIQVVAWKDNEDLFYTPCSFCPERPTPIKSCSEKDSFLATQPYQRQEEEKGKPMQTTLKPFYDETTISPLEDSLSSRSTHPTQPHPHPGCSLVEDPLPNTMNGNALAKKPIKASGLNRGHVIKDHRLTIVEPPGPSQDGQLLFPSFPLPSISPSCSPKKAEAEALLKQLIRYNMSYFTLEHRKRFGHFFSLKNAFVPDSLPNQDSQPTSQSTSHPDEIFSPKTSWNTMFSEANLVILPSVITKQQVVTTGLSSKLFPPKTTRHLFPPHLSYNNAFVALYSLFKKSYFLG